VAGSDPESRRIGTLLRGLHLLEVLADGPDGSVTELAARAGLNKGTASRLLSTLRAAGYVRQDPSTRRYRLSGRILRLSRGYVDQLDLRGLAHPYLGRLRDAVDETVHLGVMEDDRIVYIDRLEATRSLRLASAIGHTEPLPTTALGRSILSRLPSQRQREVVRGLELPARTTRTVTDVAGLLDLIVEAGRRGYAVDDQENQEHVTCVGAAVVDALGRPIAALSCSGPSVRMTGRIEQIGTLCRDAADDISRALNGTSAS
jgi:IclR family acetate operon transcriptional repressor